MHIIYTLPLDLLYFLFGYYQECDHSMVPQQRKYVRVSYFRSGWRIKKGISFLALS